VLLDRVDTYANALIERLAEVVAAVGVPTLMAMTRSDPVAMAAGIATVLGPTYVIENGRLVPISGERS